MATPSAPAGISALLRNVRGASAPMPPRPSGPLVWLHLPAGLPAGSLEALQAALDGVHLLVTSTEALPEAPLFQLFPGQRKAKIDHFINHWQPDIMLWCAPENGLAVARRLKLAGVKMLLVDTLGKGLPASLRGRQLAEFLQCFTRVLSENRAELARFKKHDLEPNQLIACKPLSEIAASPPEDEPLLRRISGVLGPRIVWCAVAVSRGEIGALLAAHRHAIKAIPNLLLIIVPRAASDVIAERIEADGWRLDQACAEKLPDKQADILLAQGIDDVGVWMRLATVSYMGGTLYGPEAADPFGAVALGSAVLCGPVHTPFSSRYARLIEAEALSLAETNGALPAKLVETLAPDASALLAMHAWNVGSEGAEAVQTIARETLALLEKGAA